MIVSEQFKSLGQRRQSAMTRAIKTSLVRTIVLLYPGRRQPPGGAPCDPARARGTSVSTLRRPALAWDVESLCEKAGLGKLSKSTAQRICSELRERFAAFQRRDLYDIRLAALFLDATFLAVRRDGPKEGVLVAWGFTEQGERVLLAVMLGMRESHEDWQALGRDLIARGLGRRC
jgi:hypothetical protein